MQIKKKVLYKMVLPSLNLSFMAFLFMEIPAVWLVLHGFLIAFCYERTIKRKQATYLSSLESYEHLLKQEKKERQQEKTDFQKEQAAKEGWEGRVEQLKQKIETYQLTEKTVSTWQGYQEEEVKETQMLMEEVVIGVSRIIETIETVSKTSKETATQAKTSGVHLHDTLEKIVSIGKSADEAERKVSEFQELYKSVKEITRFIQYISKQINLLSLNASIEAAKIRENGKGFNVVALEMKQLGLQTSESAKEIEEILTKIENKSSEVAKSIHETKDKTVSGMDSLDQTKEFFEKILESTDMISKQINNLTVASDINILFVEYLLDIMESMITINEKIKKEINEKN